MDYVLFREDSNGNPELVNEDDYDQLRIESFFDMKHDLEEMKKEIKIVKNLKKYIEEEIYDEDHANYYIIIHLEKLEDELIDMTLEYESLYDHYMEEYYGLIDKLDDSFDEKIDVIVAATTHVEHRIRYMKENNFPQEYINIVEDDLAIINNLVQNHTSIPISDEWYSNDYRKLIERDHKINQLNKEVTDLKMKNQRLELNNTNLKMNCTYLEKQNSKLINRQKQDEINDLFAVCALFLIILCIGFLIILGIGLYTLYYIDKQTSGLGMKLDLFTNQTQMMLSNMTHVSPIVQSDTFQLIGTYLNNGLLVTLIIYHLFVGK